MFTHATLTAHQTGGKECKGQKQGDALLELGSLI